MKTMREDEPFADFEIWQDGLMVAWVSGPRSRAEADAAHHALVYGQDGPVDVRDVTDGHPGTSTPSTT